MNAKSMGELADRFFSAVENHDLAEIEQIYHRDVVVWHNFDNVEQLRIDNVRLIASFSSLFRAVKYKDIRRSFFKGGCVQQHVLAGTTKAGIQFTVFACMVISMGNDKITRIEEYFDAAQLPPNESEQGRGSMASQS